MTKLPNKIDLNGLRYMYCHLISASCCLCSRQSLAYSHAKLSLRSEVTMDDALMAIKLYEESLTARFGKLIKQMLK